MHDFFSREYWGNSLISYTISIIGILLLWLLVRLTKKRLISFLKRVTKHTQSLFDDLLITAFEKLIIPYALIVLSYTIISRLNLLLVVENSINVAIKLTSVVFSILCINFLVHGFVVAYMKQRNEPEERIKQLTGILLILKIATWGLGIVMLIDNLGYNVTTIIAGLGVGGIAIALAAQNILGDLFSYFVIFFDKPFEVGDFIVVGNDSGIVEKIGIKTIHVRSLAGEQLIMPNSETVKQVIHNYKRLERRRIVFNIGVVYYSTALKLKKIPSIVKQVIANTHWATFDRAHLLSFGDFSINYELVYYIESDDYMQYMNTHHSICVSLFEKFEEEGIEFAFPTQTLFINKQNKQESKATHSHELFS